MNEIYSWIGLFLGIYLIYKFIKSLIRSSENNIIQEGLNKKMLSNNIQSIINKAVVKHKKALIIQRKQQVTIDPYGNEDKRHWYKNGLEYFFEHYLESLIIEAKQNNNFNFSLRDLSDLNKLKKDELIEIKNKIDDKIKSLIPDQKENDILSYNLDMTGLEYEHFCKDKFEQIGWLVKTTKRSNDQGVDLIIKKGKNEIAVQCKKHSSAIGNKAVQEIVAGKNYYSLDNGIVISNSTYTSAAKRLAQANNVQLLHHDEIDTFNVK